MSRVRLQMRSMGRYAQMSHYIGSLYVHRFHSSASKERLLPNHGGDYHVQIPESVPVGMAYCVGSLLAKSASSLPFTAIPPQLRKVTKLCLG